MSKAVKKYKKGKLSARWFYDNGGKPGDVVDYTESKSKVFKMLKLNKNGVPFFGTPSTGSHEHSMPRTSTTGSSVQVSPPLSTPVKQRILTPAKFDHIQAMRYQELSPRLIDREPWRLQQYQGWYASVKIDGWQGIWDGKDTLYTKSYKKSFNVPRWWLQMLQRSGVPAMAGEIIRKNSTNSADQAVLASKTNTQVWGTPDNPLAFFHVFDIVDESQRKLPFEKRITLMKKAVARACGSNPKCPIKMVPQIKITEAVSIYDMWKDTVRRGGEGLVLTAPRSKYGNFETRKSKQRVKLKGRNDDEAIVVGHNLGYRKNPAWLQSLRVQYVSGENGGKLNIGVGLTDREREEYASHYPLGSVITFSYRILSRNGTPLETRLVGRRDKSTLAENHWIHEFQA